MGWGHDEATTRAAEYVRALYPPARPPRMSANLVPAAAVVVGGAFTIAGGVLREQFTSRREREARTSERELAEEARAAEREIVRTTFQRETLLDLQDAVLRLVRNTMQLNIHHRRVYAENRTYARELDPPALSDESRLAAAEATRLRQRVLDDDLRLRVRDVQALCTQLVMPPQVTGETDAQAAERADGQSIRLAHDYADLEDHLGRVLRALL